MFKKLSYGSFVVLSALAIASAGSGAFAAVDAGSSSDVGSSASVVVSEVQGLISVVTEGEDDPGVDPVPDPGPGNGGETDPGAGGEVDPEPGPGEGGTDPIPGPGEGENTGGETGGDGGNGGGGETGPETGGGEVVPAPIVPEVPGDNSGEAGSGSGTVYVPVDDGVYTPGEVAPEGSYFVTVDEITGGYVPVDSYVPGALLAKTGSDLRTSVVAGVAGFSILTMGVSGVYLWRGRRSKVSAADRAWISRG